MTREHYEKGLSELAEGCFAYLQPDGSWGWSNAGLITDGETSLLVDTLFDGRLTAEMLATMRREVPASRDIATVVNTHANGDHCWGNQLVRGAEIIASRKGAEEMSELSPALMAKLGKVARLSRRMGPLGAALGKALNSIRPSMLGTVFEAGAFLDEIFGGFEFEGLELVLPTRTFDDHLDLHVGGKRVQLIEVGPAHTKGDLLVCVPEDRVVFTGDILFIGGHPVVWAGPVSNWVAACRRIESMDVDAIVPGHGPITDKAGASRVRRYLEYLTDEARVRYDAGMSATDAAYDIDLTEFAEWSESERIMVNVDTLYREFSGQSPPESIVMLFGQMAQYATRRSASR